jgi:hypothetical protein
MVTKSKKKTCKPTNLASKNTAFERSVAVSNMYGSLSEVVVALQAKVDEHSLALANTSEDAREWDYFEGLVDAYSIALGMVESLKGASNEG